jgi:hypothetical protein
VCDDIWTTTIHLDKHNRSYGHGETAEESVQDAIKQLAFTLALDDKDSYHGFKVSLLPEHLQLLMIEQLKRRNIQLQKRTVKITCLIGEWRSEQSPEPKGT